MPRRFRRFLARVIAAVSHLALIHPSFAQQAAHAFTADWITAEGAPGHDPAVLHLRKEVELSSAPVHFVVHVSADNQFLLLVNGRLVGQGPAVGDVQHWRYETYDLAPFLHAGRNLLSATVWDLGDVAPIRQLSSHLGFVLSPDTSAEAAAASNTSWLASRDLDVGFLPKPEELQRFYYVGSPGERLDAARLDWSWSDSGVPSSALNWKQAVSIGHAVPRGVHSESNSWLLIHDELPPMKNTPVASGRVIRSAGISGPTQFPSAPRPQQHRARRPRRGRDM